MTIRARALPSLLRCVVCHGSVSAKEGRRCGGCSAVWHLDCRLLLDACPTLGCSRRVGSPTGRHRQPPPRRPSRLPNLLRWAVVFAGVGTVAALIMIPNLIEARRGCGSGGAQIGALKTIGTSQSLFREGDKDGDGILDYGTLAELSEQDLIDTVLGSGTKQGYFFQAYPSSTTPEFLWCAVATPCRWGRTGDRLFFTNHEGVTYYATTPFAFDTASCQVPPGMNPVGK